MTSTKSLRAIVLPSLFSFPSFRSRSDSDSGGDTNTRRRRRSPWQKASLRLPRGRKLADPTRELERQQGLSERHEQDVRVAEVRQVDVSVRAGTCKPGTATSASSTLASITVSESSGSRYSQDAGWPLNSSCQPNSCRPDVDSCQPNSCRSNVDSCQPNASSCHPNTCSTCSAPSSPNKRPPTSPPLPRPRQQSQHRNTNTSHTSTVRSSPSLPVLNVHVANSYFPISPPLPLQQPKYAGVVNMSTPRTPPPPPPYAASDLDLAPPPSEEPFDRHGLKQEQQQQQRLHHHHHHLHQPQQQRAPQSPESLAPRRPPPEPQRAKPTKKEPVVEPSTAPRAAADADTEATESPRHGKLHKEHRVSRLRTKSMLQPRRTDSSPAPSLLTPGQLSPASEHRGRRSISAQASLSPSATFPHVRPASSHHPSQSPTRGRLRRSWLPGGARSRSNSVDVGQQGRPDAWVMADDAQPEYNPAFLRNAEKVPELWNETGNIYVFLYPRGTGCGPSFKVPEFVVGTSYVFNELILAEEDAAVTDRMMTNFGGGRGNLSVHDATRIASPPASPGSPGVADDPYARRLHLPAAPPTASAHLSGPGQGGARAELDRLIAIRNLFAFLTGQPLVGTRTRPTMFHAFIEIAALLQEFGFSSPDGSNFGEAVKLSFAFYSEQLALSDCRFSREKTLEALILGERMRCVDLYNEAFAHAAGKYAAIVELQLPLFGQVSPLTRQRLERAHLDLINRQHNVNEQLEQFEFPSLFAGIANSTSIPELRQVRFKAWRNSFNRMRHFLLGYYRSTFGSWPPKASSKKNPFAESGLNRLVLRMLYSDMCALYDLLVDRDNLTCRVMDEVPAISDEPSKMTTSALRNMLSEFDRSKPPVLPPIPFDLPQLPSMRAIHETFDSMSIKDQNKMEKRIKEHELILILNKAYNYDTSRVKLHFLDQFKEFEIREGRGKVTQDLVDQRIGCWLFLYVVQQSLPMLVVDAPGVRHTEGVEYFLCEPPMGNLPWDEDRQVRKMWYEVTGGGGIVELSADAVMFSVEATYRRSHCWLAAKRWEGLDGDAGEPRMSPLQPPAPMFPGGAESPMLGALPPPSPVAAGGAGTPSPPPGGPQPALRLRNLSPAERSRQLSRSSIAMGLEPVPLEPPNVFGSHNHHRGSSSSSGPRSPGSSHLGYRSSSVGNLPGMMPPRSRGSSPAPVSATSGTTFDDILGESGGQKKAPVAAAKKKGRFF